MRKIITGLIAASLIAGTFVLPMSAERENGDTVENAEITITDGVTGIVIEPEEDGSYKLCDGIYMFK